jgi:PHD/YefM family antitoxin component YafN of YafNO toxin-antitoxin module
MVRVADVLPLTDFKRDTTQWREKLHASKKPFLLTVDGRPDLVVQDANEYQRVLDELDELRLRDGLRQGVDDIKAGRGAPLEEFDRDFRARHNLPPRG